MHVIPNAKYTLDASAGTITLASPYDTLELSQLVAVIDLNTNDVVYDVNIKREGVTLSGGVITYTADSNIMFDEDDLRIVYDDMAGGGGASSIFIAGYNEGVDAVKVVEQAPLDQQVLDELLLNAVTATGASTSVFTLDKQELTVVVVASSVSTGGTLTFQGSPDNINWGTVGTVDNSGTTATTQAITGDGVFVFKVVNAGSLKWFRANLTARTDGTYTVYLFARAI
jgi:large exoprotein involved in heme utilization and adhesion